MSLFPPTGEEPSHVLQLPEPETKGRSRGPQYSIISPHPGWLGTAGEVVNSPREPGSTCRAMLPAPGFCLSSRVSFPHKHMKTLCRLGTWLLYLCYSATLHGSKNSSSTLS